MAQFNRLQVLQGLSDQGFLPIFYNPDLDTALNIARSCAQAGIRVIEFTHRGDRAHEVFDGLLKAQKTEGLDLVLGIGSIVESATAAYYINLGANFIVGPSFSREVATIANLRKVAYIPGCATPTEITTALESGVEYVKVFPASELGGANFIKAIRGPLPWVSVVATGGIKVDDSLKDWFKAGVSAVGLGSELFPSDLLSKKDWPTLSKKLSEVKALVQKARS